MYYCGIAVRSSYVWIAWLAYDGADTRYGHRRTGHNFGHMARSQIKNTGERDDALAFAGPIISYAWVGFSPC